VPVIEFRRYDATCASAVRETVALIHRDAYASVIASGDPFESHEAFMQRFDKHAENPSLDLVIAYVGDEPVGQIWGFPIPELTIPSIPAGETDEIRAGIGPEKGEMAFALCEIMVRSAWAGQGIAHSLHDELLRASTQRCAELYVRPDNARAYRAYLKWGWRKVGETRPNLRDAPLYDVLVLPLPLAR
jgi:ribosomal protein S18 acetylase RimI-like enzyme